MDAKRNEHDTDMHFKTRCGFGSAEKLAGLGLLFLSPRFMGSLHSSFRPRLRGLLQEVLDFIPA